MLKRAKDSISKLLQNHVSSELFIGMTHGVETLLRKSDLRDSMPIPNSKGYFINQCWKDKSTSWDILLRRNLTNKEANEWPNGH